MKYSIIFCFVIGSLCAACRSSVPNEDSEVLARVQGVFLNRSDVEKVIPKGISSADSLLMAENYIRKWVKDVLAYDVAKKNIGSDEADISRLVEEYRHSLIRHRYEENLVRTRLSAEIRESEKRTYFQENPQKFLLDKNLIKGLFLKVPADAPRLNDVRKWYKSNDPKAVESIEKYSIQNASIYEYFYDRWVDFEEVSDKIPVHIPDAKQYLKANRSIETTDSAYIYFLNISECLLAGNTSPYEYAEPQIREIMINKKKMDFIRGFEEELYRDAIRKGDVIFYTNQE
ncbi:MAG: peptidyl-prolyl cis-trans isomerase [Tannerella sp.]|jgi:hypothetical protein|nr:peptidyl-prolyl cis-trans isomerase [Tannerella sp.]